MSVKAYLFDMDGTLADSEKPFVDQIFELLNNYNFKGTYHDVEENIMGSTVELACEWISEETGISYEEVIEKFNTMFNGGLIDYKPYIYKETKIVLDTLKQEGYKIALVTANGRENINNFLSCGFEDSFDCIVSTVEDKLDRKPAPDCYLLAMKRLGVKPHECIVIEDSFMGIEAGLASEAYVIGICQSSLHGDISHAHRTIKNLIELIQE